MDFQDLRKEYQCILASIDIFNFEKDFIQKLFEDPEFDWNIYIGQVVMHRLSGLVFYGLMKNGITNLPHEIEFGFHRIYDAQKQRVLSMHKYIMELSDALEQKGVEHAFLKGSILSNSFYPLGTRSSNDIDLLINSKSISTASKVVCSLGYTQGEYNFAEHKVDKLDRSEIIFRRMNFGEVVPFYKIIEEPGLDVVEVDINFSLDWLTTGSEEVISQMLHERRLYNITEDLSISSLGTEDFFIHLLMHMYKDCVMYDMVKAIRDLTLYKFIDTYMYLHQYNIDWAKLVLRCKDYKLEEGCFYALEYIRTVFPKLNDDISFLNTLQSIRPDNLSYLDEVIHLSKNELYTWKGDILERLFDNNKMNELVINS